MGARRMTKGLGMPRPGWYDDPQDPKGLRWWDGIGWTGHRQPRDAILPPPANSAYDIPLEDPFQRGASGPGWETIPPPPPVEVPLPTAPVPFSATTSAGERAGGAAPSRSFTESVRTGFENYAVFRGRASRSEYWYWAIFLLLALIASGVLGMAIDGDAVSTDSFLLGEIVVLVIFGGLVLPSLSVTVRRLHDIGMNGWFVLLLLVPWINLASVAIFGLLSGQYRENAHK